MAMDALPARADAPSSAAEAVVSAQAQGQVDKGLEPQADTGEAADLAPQSDAGRNMYRLYNPNSGEHFYTASLDEARNVFYEGWHWEGVGWVAPSTGHDVYRLYNPNAGDHHYTLSPLERDSLVNVGWRYEGVGWKSGGTGVVLRQYNPNATTGTHNFTTSSHEDASLGQAGWNREGQAWNCLDKSHNSIKGFWALSKFSGGLERYWIASDCQVARSRYITPSEGAGYNAYARPSGAVVRGAWDNGAGRVLLANNDGKLTEANGWIVTSEYAGQLQRYYIDGKAHAAISGHFFADGAHYWGRAGVGYVLRGRLAYGNGVLLANNDGKLAWNQGWLVTDEYDGQMQRYYIDDSMGNGLHGAHVGKFFVDAKGYYGRKDTGYVVRGTYSIQKMTVQTGAVVDDIVAIADNDGVLLTREQIGRRVVDAARSQIGCAYTTDDNAAYPGQAYNCSGLSWWSYQQVGVNLTRNQGYHSYYMNQDNISNSQMWMIDKRGNWRTGTNELVPGDLVFFSPIRNKFHTGHVGVYIGDGKMIDSHPNGGVQIRGVGGTTFVGGGLPVAYV